MYAYGREERAGLTTTPTEVVVHGHSAGHGSGLSIRFGVAGECVKVGGVTGVCRQAPAGVEFA